MFGSIIGGIGKGIVGGLGNMNSGPQPDPSGGYGQYVVDPGFDTRIDMGIAPGSPGSFNPGAFTYF